MSAIYKLFKTMQILIEWKLCYRWKGNLSIYFPHNTRTMLKFWQYYNQQNTLKSLIKSMGNPPMALLGYQTWWFDYQQEK